MWLYNNFPFLKGGGGKKDSRSLRRFAERENNRLWQDVFIRNINLLSMIFEWDGLPETVSELFFEQQLLFTAYACIVYDNDFASYLGLPCTAAGKMNIYYENGIYRAYSLGYSKQFYALTKYNKSIFDKMLNGYVNAGVKLQGVVCHDNPCDYPLINTVEIYTDRMVRAMRAIDVVQNQAKLTTIIETDEDTKLAIQEAIASIDENVLAVYVSRDIAKKLRESKSIQTQFAPAVLDVLWNHVNNIKSEMLTAFGVNNLNTADKKERLLSDEVNSNNQAIGLNLSYRRKCRQLFADNLNAVFGLNVTVRLNDNLMENVGPQSLGGKNGTIQPNTGGNIGNS